GEPHQLWNNLIGTNVIPERMTYDELIAGFRELIQQVTGDAAIADRIRNKLPHLGRVPVPFRSSFGTALAYLGRFLLRGVVRGGPRRWYHFARSLVPVLRRPRLLPFAILNWVQGVAIQEFVREHLRNVPASEASVSPRQLAASVR